MANPNHDDRGRFSIGRAVSKVARMLRGDKSEAKPKQQPWSTPSVRDVTPAKSAPAKNTMEAKTFGGKLKNVEMDNAAFDKLAEGLGKMSKDEVRQAAVDYLGYEPKKSKGKADLIRDIKDRQMVAKRQEGRMANIGRMKSW